MEAVAGHSGPSWCSPWPTEAVNWIMFYYVCVLFTSSLLPPDMMHACMCWRLTERLQAAPLRNWKLRQNKWKMPCCQSRMIDSKSRLPLSNRKDPPASYSGIPFPFGFYHPMGDGLTGGSLHFVNVYRYTTTTSSISDHNGRKKLQLYLLSSPLNLLTTIAVVANKSIGLVWISLLGSIQCFCTIANCEQRGEKS